jgi:hypothetical protein
MAEKPKPTRPHGSAPIYEIAAQFGDCSNAELIRLTTEIKRATEEEHKSTDHIAEARETRERLFRELRDALHWQSVQAKTSAELIAWAKQNDKFM